MSYFLQIFSTPCKTKMQNNIIQFVKYKAKRSAKQQRSDLVIVFLVQCSQCSVDQTGHPQNKSYSAQLLTAAERCKNSSLMKWLTKKLFQRPSCLVGGECELSVLEPSEQLQGLSVTPPSAMAVSSSEHQSLSSIEGPTRTTSWTLPLAQRSWALRLLP